MAHYREAPCIYYICKGQCSKGKEAEQTKLCQHCDKYRARKGFKKSDKRYKERNKNYASCYYE